jgi:hypothetical protein
MISAIVIRRVPENPSSTLAARSCVAGSRSVLGTYSGVAQSLDRVVEIEALSLVTAVVGSGVAEEDRLSLPMEVPSASVLVLKTARGRLLVDSSDWSLSVGAVGTRFSCGVDCVS